MSGITPLNDMKAYVTTGTTLLCLGTSIYYCLIAGKRTIEVISLDEDMPQAYLRFASCGAIEELSRACFSLSLANFTRKYLDLGLKRDTLYPQLVRKVHDMMHRILCNTELTLMGSSYTLSFLDASYKNLSDSFNCTLAVAELFFSAREIVAEDIAAPVTSPPISVKAPRTKKKPACTKLGHSPPPPAPASTVLKTTPIHVHPPQKVTKQFLVALIAKHVTRNKNIEINIMQELENLGYEPITPKRLAAEIDRWKLDNNL